MKIISQPLFAILLAATTSHAYAAEPAPAPSDEIVVSAVGDIMLDASSRPVMDKEGYDYVFAQVRPFFSGSHIVFGNLEGPLTDHGAQEQDKRFTFRSPPDKVSAALKNAGINVVTLANNHTLDYGAEGLAQTLETLDAAGIRHVGAGPNITAARQPAIMEVNGKKVALLGYSITLPENFYATEHRPGTAFAYEEQVQADIIAARKQADIVLVAFHWGQEGKTQLREYQTRIGRLAIDSGASAVIGHHPHILQGIEKYHGGIILYSMGNFAFASYSSHSTRSAIAQLHFRKGRLQELRMIPLNVNNFEVQFQPKPLQGEEADAVIATLQKLSAARHTEVRNEQGVGVVTLP
jgi:poly-gamma-glutamate synthesis protein (capsule biosynthesis protein)